MKDSGPGGCSLTQILHWGPWTHPQGAPGPGYGRILVSKWLLLGPELQLLDVLPQPCSPRYAHTG